MMQTLKEKIKQRRTQMLVHSYLYYKCDETLVSDDKWQKWADELREIQNANPKECNIDFFDEEFKDWNGDTGMHLKFNSWVVQKANYLREIC